MKRLAFAILLIAIAGIGCAAGGVLALYYLSTDSFGSAGWHQRFEEAMRRDGEVRLADLVSFEWDAIFLVGSYDLTASLARRREILGSEQTLWWEDSQSDWTIVYRRPGTLPFIVRMRADDWHFRALSYLSTSEPTAKLRLIDQGSLDAERCPRRNRGSRCLFLEDSRPQRSGR
jgi:hypothetical protein